jgi:hypothetical protein
VMGGGRTRCFRPRCCSSRPCRGRPVRSSSPGGAHADAGPPVAAPPPRWATGWIPCPTHELCGRRPSPAPYRPGRSSMT